MATDRQERLDMKADRPVGALLSDLTREMTTLVGNEIALAKSEVNEKISQLGTAGVSLVVGGAIAYAGLLVLLAAAVAGLAEALPADMAPWLSPLIVGAVVAIVGYVLLQMGINRMRAANLAPRRTIQSLQRDRDFAKDTLRRDREPLRRDHEPEKEHVR